MICLIYCRRSGAEDCSVIEIFGNSRCRIDSLLSRRSGMMFMSKIVSYIF